MLQERAALGARRDEREAEHGEPADPHAGGGGVRRVACDPDHAFDPCVPGERKRERETRTERERSERAGPRPEPPLERERSDPGEGESEPDARRPDLAERRSDHLADRLQPQEPVQPETESLGTGRRHPGQGRETEPERTP